MRDPRTCPCKGDRLVFCGANVTVQDANANHVVYEINGGRDDGDRHTCSLVLWCFEAERAKVLEVASD